MIWVAVLLALVAFSYIASERMRRPMDARARARGEAPGRFAKLSQGITHYRWQGPVAGPVAVCIHGLTSSSYVWDEVAQNLTRMGYRVLRYDLYGRGLSDRPEGRQDRDFFLQQLRDLLAHEGLDDDLTLVGYSMGGAIATAFASEEPNRVDRLMLIAPAGLGHTPGRLAGFARDVPVLGDWMIRVVGGWHQRRAARVAGRQPGVPADLPGKQAGETRFRGYMPAILSSLRHMLPADQAADHRRIAEAGIPVLAVWGEADETIRLAALGRLAEINRAAMQVSLPEASHALVYTRADDIHSAMQDFLREM
ncbi:pimeloyl-ACP methyl ester carboxylesterase [Rhodovulum iodosum]|uniref:Pimeloyl-ACP methyl ester carboxylesterase n=1 Tax=Rhodovulum iodosum TaxID=68291 RepID=A0ABV3XXJ3_9RHOB|nr:alpha/beta hydrolase [Rhodovulum robiginosum]RSK38076.1 alpha/beta hydrolase [Rhodovulum robiginosum]